MNRIPFLSPMRNFPFFWVILFFIFCYPLYAEEMEKILQEGIKNGLTVDLREPLYVDGVITTEKGGVITASQLRIQAIYMRYTRKEEKGNSIWTIEAEGDLIVEFGEYIFVGKSLFYDFNKKEGFICYGKTEIEPWYFGGEKLELRPDGSYIVYNGYVTTSERDQPDWAIHSDVVTVQKEHALSAQKVSVRVLNYSVLWIPSLRLNLDSIFDSPIRYRFRWGGRQGPRLGLTYEIFSWENWKTFVRFDYRLTRGPGGGIETSYASPDQKTTFHSINYLAKDSSILHPHEKARYRFEGTFHKWMDEDKTRILLTYDKISDKDMPSVYYDRDFDFDTSKRTQLLVRREEPDWIANFYTRVRINSFQTVKQELPSLNVNFKTFNFRRTGLMFENWASASYLDFEYSKYLRHVKNYSSTRFDYRPTFYLPLTFSRFFTFTPELGMVTILYGNSPEKDSQWLFLGKSGLNLQTQLYRYYGDLKHVIKPYAYYRYYSSPTSSAHQHYIFDLNDGWARLNYLSFGVHQSFYTHEDASFIKRVFSADIYSFAFFHTKKMHQIIPKVYSRFLFFFLPTIKYIVDAAWNLEHHQIEYFNIRTEWTVHEDLAVAVEFRHRGPYRWRKVDEENFFLDVFHSENQLVHSPLSDRRDTLLFHLFYRFHPNWACEFTSRQGWNRRREPGYFEFEIDLLTTIQTAWHIRFSYQHQENDDRVAMFLNIGLSRPNPSTYSNPVHYFD